MEKTRASPHENRHGQARKAFRHSLTDMGEDLAFCTSGVEQRANQVSMVWCHLSAHSDRSVTWRRAANKKKLGESGTMTGLGQLYCQTGPT